MESTHILNKINKTRNRALYILFSLLILISIPFVLWFFNNAYLPHQSKTKSFSNPRNFYPYILTDKKYKDIEIKLIDADGKAFKLNSTRTIDPDDIDGYVSQTPYQYATENNNLRKNSNTKNFKVVITNKSNKPCIIQYGVWSHYVEEYSNHFIKRKYF